MKRIDVAATILLYDDSDDGDEDPAPERTDIHDMGNNV